MNQFLKIFTRSNIEIFAIGGQILRRVDEILLVFEWRSMRRADPAERFDLEDYELADRLPLKRTSFFFIETSTLFELNDEPNHQSAVRRTRSFSFKWFFFNQSARFTKNLMTDRNWIVDEIIFHPDRDRTFQRSFNNDSSSSNSITVPTVL